MSQLDAHARQFIVHQARDGLHGDATFAHIEDNASIPFTKFDIGKRPDRMAVMRATIKGLFTCVNV
jgi:hypothetical protein